MYIIPSKDGVPHIISRGQSLSKAILKYLHRLGATTVRISPSEKHDSKVVSLLPYKSPKATPDIRLNSIV